MIKDDLYFNNKKLYNDGKLHDGMTTVPFVVEKRKTFIEMGGNPENIEVYHTNQNKPYLVAYTEVSREEFESYMKFFNKEVSSYLDNYGEKSYKEKFSRCTINGKPCGIRNHCSSCKREDDNGILLKETKKGIISLDAESEYGYEPADNASDLKMIVDELIVKLTDANPLYGAIISKLYEGQNKTEIIAELPLQR